MQQIVKIIYRIFLPVLSAYVFLLASPPQLNAEVAQRSLLARIVLVIFLGLLFWATGNAFLESGQNITRFWKNLGAFGYQERSLYSTVFMILGALAMLAGFTVIISNAITKYLPNWVAYHQLIVGFTLIVEAAGLSRNILDILNTIDIHKENK